MKEKINPKHITLRIMIKEKIEYLCLKWKKKNEIK
jgi:hypothetical protein